MKVKELNEKLDSIFNILENDEIFSNMLELGYFDDHRECKEHADYGVCYNCSLNFPSKKITINDLLDCEKDIKDYEKSFYLAYENYMSNL
jgi:hypothetical protein